MNLFKFWPMPSTNHCGNNGQSIWAALADTSTAAHGFYAMHSTPSIATAISRAKMWEQKNYSARNTRIIREMQHRSSRFHQTWEHRSLCNRTWLWPPTYRFGTKPVHYCRGFLRHLKIDALLQTWRIVLPGTEMRRDGTIIFGCVL